MFKKWSTISKTQAPNSKWGHRCWPVWFCPGRGPGIRSESRTTGWHTMSSKGLPFIQGPEHPSLGSWAFTSSGKLWLLRKKMYWSLHIFGCSKIIGGKWQKKDKFQNFQKEYAGTSLDSSKYFWAIPSTWSSFLMQQRKESKKKQRGKWYFLSDYKIIF